METVYLIKMPTTKAERTIQYILEIVAPIFSTHGYAGTSLSHLTEATGLTKGAIYGHFKNKEELALAAFNYKIRQVVGEIAVSVESQESAKNKLQAITDFYRRYYDNYSLELSGCMVINVAVDTNYSNPVLYARVKEIIGKLKNAIGRIIEAGIAGGEFNPSLDADLMAGRIYSQIQGSVFMSVMLKDRSYIDDMLNHIDTMIEEELCITA